jgi:hypothetical protein
MNLASFIIAAALIALIAVVGGGFALQKRRAGRSSFALELVPLDVEAFRNLTDPAEDDYLRLRLPPAELRKVRRARLRAMAAYVRLASRNAAMLAEFGQAALVQDDSRRAEAARQMVNDAFQLRRNASVALARIYLGIALPGARSAVNRFQDQYVKVGASAMLFGRLQDPQHASRFTVAVQ